MWVGAAVRWIVERLPMRFRGAFLVLLAITLIDFLVPDLIPFVDEIILALLTILLGLWRDRRAAKPPRVPILLVLALLAVAAAAGCVPARNGGSAVRAAPGVEGARASSSESSAAAAGATSASAPQPRSTAALGDLAPAPSNPWSRAARDALVAPCGRCHQSTLPTADPKALAIFDLDQPAWSATMSRDQIESLGGRARGSTRLGPAEKDAVERFIRCALEGECSEG